MDTQLKTRLIGAAIIVSLVVIFVPMLFEDSADTTVSETGQGALPEFPKSEFESQALPLPAVVPAAQPQGQNETPAPAEPIEDEALDPLDMPPPKAPGGTGSSADVGGAVGEEQAEETTLPTKPASAAKPVQPKPSVAGEAKPAEKTHVQLKDKEKEPPAKPKSQTPTQPVATKPKPAADRKPPAPAVEAAKKEVVSPAKEAPKLVAWVVQAGSFSDEANAKALMQKLRQAKIPAFVEMVPGATGNSWRVRVGPELERAKADAILKKMESDAGVKGMIVSYP